MDGAQAGATWDLSENSSFRLKAPAFAKNAKGRATRQERIHHVDVRRLDSAGMTLNAAELKGARHRVYYFGDHFERK